MTEYSRTRPGLVWLLALLLPALALALVSGPVGCGNGGPSSKGGDDDDSGNNADDDDDDDTPAVVVRDIYKGRLPELPEPTDDERQFAAVYNGGLQRLGEIPQDHTNEVFMQRVMDDPERWVGTHEELKHAAVTMSTGRYRDMVGRPIETLGRLIKEVQARLLLPPRERTSSPHWVSVEGGFKELGTLFRDSVEPYDGSQHRMFHTALQLVREDKYEEALLVYSFGEHFPEALVPERSRTGFVSSSMMPVRDHVAFAIMWDMLDEFAFRQIRKDDGTPGRIGRGLELITEEELGEEAVQIIKQHTNNGHLIIRRGLDDIREFWETWIDRQFQELMRPVAGRFAALQSSGAAVTAEQLDEMEAEANALMRTISEWRSRKYLDDARAHYEQWQATLEREREKLEND